VVELNFAKERQKTLDSALKSKNPKSFALLGKNLIQHQNQTKTKTSKQMNNDSSSTLLLNTSIVPGTSRMLFPNLKVDKMFCCQSKYYTARENCNNFPNTPEYQRMMFALEHRCDNCQKANDERDERIHQKYLKKVTPVVVAAPVSVPVVPLYQELVEYDQRCQEKKKTVQREQRQSRRLGAKLSIQKQREETLGKKLSLLNLQSKK
jgi:hypothetical protein